MKITKDTLQEVKPLLVKTNFDMEDMRLFFPLDLKIIQVDEFGIEIKKYQSESFYGNAFVPGLVIERIKGVNFVKLAYAPTTSLISFNYGEYSQLIWQGLNQSELDTLCSFECCLVKNTEAHTVIQELK